MGVAAPDVVPVDLAGRLPEGTTVLDASAGTGKTYTIAGLVTRYVAEGHARLDQLLVVTFGRAATGELRTRVRERLFNTCAALADLGAASESADPVVAWLARGSADEVAERRARLTEALADFDAATVATIHQFCQEVLRGLGSAADLDPGTELVETLDDLVSEVCDDLYLRFHCRPGAPAPQFTHERARAVARAAIEDPHAHLVPSDAIRDSAADVRVRFAVAVRAETERRKRARRIQGFDDLLGRVRDALAHPVTGDIARTRLQDRYQVVLVDEFQDTDPVQWDVFRLAFHGSRTLVLIGDPKQSIYAFRGADIRAYLSAAAAAGTRATLDTNWRSDPRILDGLQTIFRGAALGDPAIVVRPVRAGHRRSAFEPLAPEPVQLRMLPRAGLPLVQNGTIRVPAAREAVAADVAAQVRAVLYGGHTIAPRSDGRPRALTCADMAVLVRTGAQAGLVRDALLAQGVPSVLTGASSVFATSGAEDWLRLLEALGQPHRRGLVRRLALTPWIGWSAAELDARGDAATDELVDALRDWEEVFSRRGVGGLFTAVADSRGLSARLLQRPDGERLLTDRRHIAEALHAEAADSRLGVSGLVAWLRDRLTESGGDQDQERSRRLDTDDAAVQVVTVHASKGLEFPVVFVPFAWDTSGGGSQERLPRIYDDSGRRIRHVGGSNGPGYAQACRAEARDSAGEELRLLYVAATRAVCRLVLWWAGSSKTATSPLHRVLFSADPAVEVPLRVPVPADDDAEARLRMLSGAAPGGVDVAVVASTATGGIAAPSPAAADASRLAADELRRTLDTGWRRTSYTRLTRDAHEAPAAVVAEPETDGQDDEIDELLADDDADGSPALQRLRQIPSPMADLAGGTIFGTLAHAVLEKALGGQGDPLNRLRAAAHHQLLGHGGGPSAEELATALETAVSTPLGVLADGRRLTDIASRDILTELDFELPLAGGDVPLGDVRLGAVADLLRRYLPAADRMVAYPDALGIPELADQPLRGFLTGSLDAVIRLGEAEEPRYVVVDYKTNRLAPPTVPLTAWHYRASALDAAVIRAHYPLQALLYQVALHRFLRWRQPGYLPDRHLGGVLYLFLRGMCGARVGAAPEDEIPGVWSWCPPASLVVALSDLLAGDAR
ncbi:MULTISPECIES: UvrD-helicase domain-containing protein [unclassified Modestobacter]|uniref:UvrD-helicase domain-containing protein n=1 Tax=unclassified Modestobacter TaxID=2643866 RepID=UPI0022AAB282|nr:MULTISPECIES: UvrD-helicase domain-containing protein [unclassified Modestobacter]MCZ2826038.1 UvrD-helicase domain-containing protein [Modestobacter sp. VKM Ac-2981]MCZ2852897.1 UvrD-helicase domain-containing protein [Modestobacter sp. VKM Ac-2982]